MTIYVGVVLHTQSIQWLRFHRNEDGTARRQGDDKKNAGRMGEEWVKNAA